MIIHNGIKICFAIFVTNLIYIAIRNQPGTGLKTLTSGNIPLWCPRPFSPDRLPAHRPNGSNRAFCIV